MDFSTASSSLKALPCDSLAIQLEGHADCSEFFTQVLFSINDKSFLGPAFLSFLPKSFSSQYLLYDSETLLLARESLT